MVDSELSSARGGGNLSPPHPPLSTYYRPGAGARRRFVNELFDDTAEHYDWINRFMSLGSGAYYRRDVLRRAGLDEGMSVLDVAIGTGLVARAARSIVGEPARVVGIDLSLGMLREARRRYAIPLIRGLAEKLPLADASFDFVTMGYALRHVEDLEVTFRECHRVLKPGGRFVVLEIARPASRLRRAMARFYLKHAVPFVAGLGSGDKKSETLMTYFWETIEHCVPQQTVRLALERTAFSVSYSQLWGTFSEYVARKPASTSGRKGSTA